MSNMRSQMGKMMESIQVVARGQEAVTRGQEEMRQANLQVVTANAHIPTPATPTVQTPMGIPMGNYSLVGKGLVNPNVIPAFSPPVIEVDNQDDAFFVLRDKSVFDAFGLANVEMQNKVCAITEKMRAMEGFNTFRLDAVEMCLVPNIQIPAKFKVSDFEKYKGISYSRTHVKAYYLKMAAYSNDEKLLMHFL